jgi:serine/threonine protein kinase
MSTNHPLWIDLELPPWQRFIRDQSMPPATNRETGWLEHVVDSTTGKRFTLKVLRRSSSWQRALANNELRAHLAARDSSCVVLLMDAYLQGQNLVLVFPRLEETTFRFAHKTKNLLDVKKGFRCLCAGLESLHSLGLAHGDVSPNNIMRSPEMKQPLWIDLGLSRFVPACPPRPNCGTPGFIAPDDPTKCSLGTEPDMWAFGCLLGRALADVIPSESKLSLLLQRAGTVSELSVLFGTLQAKEGRTPAIATAMDLLGGLLQLDPSKRLRAPAALKHPFFTGAKERQALGELSATSANRR